MDSVVEAVDLYFKSFHALHTTYPALSSHIWVTVQRAVYQFRTEWDAQCGIIPSWINAYARKMKWRIISSCWSFILRTFIRLFSGFHHCYDQFGSLNLFTIVYYYDQLVPSEWVKYVVIDTKFNWLIKMFWCPRCELTFLLIESLIVHIRFFHLNVESSHFSCKQPGCHKHFSLLSMHKRHLSSDHNEIPRGPQLQEVSVHVRKKSVKSL